MIKLFSFSVTFVERASGLGDSVFNFISQHYLHLGIGLDPALGGTSHPQANAEGAPLAEPQTSGMEGQAANPGGRAGPPTSTLQ